MLALVALALLSPVPGDVARGFAYAGDLFAAGHHRGVDLATRPGERVRAACGGRVLFAGGAGANGRAVTIRCGRFNVTHLPLATLTTEAGATLPPGAPIGTAARARGHEGLHLGVRRATDPLGYIDPAPLLRTPHRPAPPAAPRSSPQRPAPPPPHPEPLPSMPAAPAPLPRAERLPRAAPLPHAPLPRAAPVPHALLPRAAPPQAARPGSSPPLAPWPAWAGLALLLSGAAGSRSVRARRRRRAARQGPAPAPVR
jgi:hypothetical protein